MNNETKIQSIPVPPGKAAFESNESLEKLWYICCGICFSLATITFFMRSYARVLVARTWVHEDWMACLVFMLLMLFLGCNAGLFANKGGHHMRNLTYDEASTALYWFNNSIITYGVSVCFTKLALTNLYRRIFNLKTGSTPDVVLRLFRWTIIAFYFSQTVAKLLGCIPTARTWNKRIPGRCVNKAAILNSSGMFNCITDLFLLLIPVKFVWELQLSRWKKIRVLLTFTFGALAPLFSIIGTVTRILVSGKSDATYNFGYIVLCTSSEATIGVILLFLPAVPIIFRKRNHKATPTQNIFAGRELRSSNLSEQDITTQQRLERNLGLGLSDGELRAPRGEDIELQDLGAARCGNQAREVSMAATVRRDSMEITRIG
ncbi:hypothetical protein BJ875DRAFT_500203 [Amylocarpus encephaloides]|uniref:Rhodopsin domain-containing protein n=1 Tax=Amylocarpus encephaloides TaxID=45428 RepID=A0A9P8C0R2_9HELO|nr:hypothetical protein BJ875DRAFT_500203 [Amylocarpus encephaloides]